MEITKNVILDLLPLYLADEVRPDTRELVEKFLETDPELATIAKQSAKNMELPQDIPIPLTKEDKMDAFEEAKRLQFKRTLIWAGVIALVVLSLLGLALLAFFMLVSVV
jgi:hypothetical protein